MCEVAAEADDASVAHLMTSLSATVVFYAAVTRGALVVAWALSRASRKTG